MGQRSNRGCTVGHPTALDCFEGVPPSVGGTRMELMVTQVALNSWIAVPFIRLCHLGMLEGRHAVNSKGG